ncbi:MAG TPA: hypothetical protein VKU62_02130 [Thermoanaerobaculia bacterium]|nr:hypothetical protein [Thermoanaerobaculia bacterium]
MRSLSATLATLILSLNVLAATIRAVGPMTTARQEHTATLLADGTVLIAGGVNSMGPDIPLHEEIYDPQTRTFHAIAGMETARLGHAAITLQDGEVLLVGGFSSSAANSETYTPTLGAFSSLAPMSGERYHVGAVRLADGRVLAVGGNRGGMAIGTSEIFNPTSGAWATGASMSQPREGPVVVRLNDGRVVVGGGSNASPVEFFDPASGKFTVVPNTLVFALHGLLLPSGKMLFVGLGMLQVFDPATGAVITSSNRLKTYRGEAVVLLPDGTVLIAGGNVDGSVLSDAVYIWSPAADSLTSIGKLTVARDTPTATPLQDGTVLITGGFTLPGFASSAVAEIITFGPSRARAVRH